MKKGFFRLPGLMQNLVGFLLFCGQPSNVLIATDKIIDFEGGTIALSDVCSPCSTRACLVGVMRGDSSTSAFDFELSYNLRTGPYRRKANVETWNSPRLFLYHQQTQLLWP